MKLTRTVCWCIYWKCNASIGKRHAWNTNVLQFAECKKALQFVMINLWQNEKYDHNAFCAKHELFAFFKGVHWNPLWGAYFKMRFFRGYWKREVYVWRLFHALNDPSHSIILPQKAIFEDLLDDLIQPNTTCLLPKQIKQNAKTINLTLKFKLMLRIMLYILIT